MGETGGKDSTVHHFAKISRTASMTASWKLHILLRTSLGAAKKKCMTCIIMSYDVTWDCVRYSCKYSVVSVIGSDFVLISVDWMQR